MIHVVNFSFGVSSWAAAKLVARRHGTENLILLNADPKWEDEDTYAWGEAAAKNVGGELVRIADGRTPFQVFRDERMLGSSRADPCSKILKRELLDRYMEQRFGPVKSDVTCYVGLHWSERDRFERWDSKEQAWKGVKHRMAQRGWRCEAPLCEPPFLGVTELHAWADSEGLWKQRLYRLGFPHANCGGRCVKQGQAGWKRLLEAMP